MMGSNGRSRAFTSRNRGVVASAWLFQSGIPADSNSRPAVFNGSKRQWYVWICASGALMGPHPHLRSTPTLWEISHRLSCRPLVRGRNVLAGPTTSAPLAASAHIGATAVSESHSVTRNRFRANSMPAISRVSFYLPEMTARSLLTVASRLNADRVDSIRVAGRRKMSDPPGVIPT
jgi:hypothetical protein